MNILVALCFLLCTSAGIAVPVQQLNNNYDLKAVIGDLVEINGNYYFISAAEVSFAEALQGCYDISMKLISVQSEAKQIMLEEFLKNNKVYDSNLFWTSGMRYSGSEFMWSSTGQPFTYTNWYEDNPDEPSTTIDVFVMITHSFFERKWLDIENSSRYKYNFICEQRDKFD